MKLAEYVARFLEAQGISHAYGVSGGASLHLIHGITDASKIQFIPTQHECHAGFAADCHARLNGLGVAIATSGPGAANLITAIATSYYDSVPVIYITGNCTTNRFGSQFNTPVRQYGFQEMPIVEMVAEITKYAKQVVRAEDIAHILVRAAQVATSGRKGPVLIDIPDDLQRATVTKHWLKRIDPIGQKSLWSRASINEMVTDLNTAERPLLLFGAGIRGCSAQATMLARSMGVPFASTWGAKDCFDSYDALFVGAFGTHGTRAANLMVANADFILAIGTRLDTKATADPTTFARGANRYMVDIDDAEIGKMNQLSPGFLKGWFSGDAGDFLTVLDQAPIPKNVPRERLLLHTIERLRNTYDAVTPDWPGPDPYDFMHRLGVYTRAEDVIVCDTGLTVGWAMQAFPFKGERFIHAFNMTPMGYAMPAALGAALATGRRVVVLVGDGSIMMTLSEMATLSARDLNVKVMLFDNKGHGMCRQTQRQWLGGKTPSTSIEGGLSFPSDWGEVRRAMGFERADTLADLFESDGPAMMVLDIAQDAHLIPQARFGQPIEDADPLLPWDEFVANMVVEPLPRKS